MISVPPIGDNCQVLKARLAANLKHAEVQVAVQGRLPEEAHMLVENHAAQDEELFSYVVASGDMRFIENSQRALYLRRDPELGLIIRGEVPECGPTCHANLSQVLLEYVMSCEDGRMAHRTAVAADRFGRRLGEAYIERRFQLPLEAPNCRYLRDAVEIVLNSMDAAFEVEHACAAPGERPAGVISYTLSSCPLHSSAAKAGLTMWVPLAHRALVAMIETLLHGLAPVLSLQAPVERETAAPLLEIRFARIVADLQISPLQLGDPPAGP